MGVRICVPGFRESVLAFRGGVSRQRVRKNIPQKLFFADSLCLNLFGCAQQRLRDISTYLRGT